MDQTGRSPEVMAAVRENYIPLRTQPIATNNTRLGVFVPITVQNPEERAEKRQRWQEFKRSLASLYGGDRGVEARFGLWYNLIPESEKEKQKPAPVKAAAPAATANPPKPKPVMTPKPTPSPTPTPPPQKLVPQLKSPVR